MSVGLVGLDCCCRCACSSSIRLSVKTCWNQFLHQVYITQSNACMLSYPSGVYAVCLFIPLYLTNREILKDCCAAPASRIYSQFPGNFTLSALHPTAKSGLWKLIQPSCFVSNILFPNVLLQLWIHMQSHNPNLRIICKRMILQSLYYQWPQPFSHRDVALSPQWWFANSLLFTQNQATLA